MRFKIKPKFLLLLPVCLFFRLSSVSQTVTLGSGTEINSITTSSPINIWYRKTVCQMVYTAAELTAGGAVSGLISELGFYVSNNPIYNLPNYEIQIKHTLATDASGDLEGGYTTVKTISSYAPSVGWDMLTLDTPFEWNGVQNIVVRVCWSQVTPSFDPSGQLRVYTSANGYKFRRSDTGGSMCGDVPSTVLNIKPQLRLVFESETKWNGLVSPDWFDGSNWTAGVPDETVDAIIPAGTPNIPVLNGMASCKNLLLDGALTLGGNGQIDIYENFIATGTYNDMGGVTNFTGPSAHELSTVSDLRIENFRLNSSAGLEVLAGNIVIGRELQVNKGILKTGDAITINSDAVGTARIDELSTTCTYTLDMTDTWGDGWNGGFITVFEDGTEIGTFAGVGATSSATFKIVEGATFTINYTRGTYENENAYTLTDEDGLVVFSDGTNPDEGDVFSDVAAGCSFSSTIEGKITMERYINEGETFWRYFASAVENPMIEQYLDNFTTAGFPGTPFPDFPFVSVYSYDETMPAGEGYIPCSGTDEIIEVGEGYQIWCGDTITGTDPFLVDLVGPPNQGDISLPVTYTPSADPGEDGWCLIGNPYPSSIDWDSPDWTKTNMANATYIQDPDSQNYATYIAGAGANGGTRYIASQQSFWVRAVAASPVLLATEGVKANVDATYFLAGETHNQGMTIQLDGGEAVDEAILRHVEGAVNEFEPEVDAIKLFGGWGINPQVSLINTEAKDMTIHSFDKGYEEWHIPLRTIVFESGEHELRFLNVFELGVPCMQLEDTYSGEMYSIEEGTALTFEMSDTSYAPRFILHVGRNYDFEKEHVACNGYEDGLYELDLDHPEELTYELSGEDWIETETETADPLYLDNLDAGTYMLYVEGFADLCATDTFYFTIHEPFELNLDAVVTDETYGSDGAIETEIDGGTDPYTFEWSTGETTASVYGLPAGVYDVSVTDANSCTFEASYTVDSHVSLEEDLEQDNIQFVYNENMKTIYLSGELLREESAVSLYAVSGELIKTYQFSEGMQDLLINLPVNLAEGMYILKPETVNWVRRFAY